MRTLQHWLDRIRVVAIVITLWFGGAGSLLAAAPAGGPTQSEKSYVIPYMLVVLACALGLVIVCRSSNRTNEIERSDDD